MQLITEKISLPQARPPLSRQRLLGLLREGLERYSATIISGRAGTGKTLLAADFARQCGRRVAWYKVDAADNRPGIFCQYLLESVRRQRTDSPRQAGEGNAEAAGENDVCRVAEAVAYELQEAATEPLLIVVEDLHLIYDEAWVAPFFARLIPLLPADAHLLIVARGVPPAPLWRMRSKQMLAVVDEYYLAFTLEEARRLFASYGLQEGAAVKPLTYSHGRAAVLDEIARERRGAAGEAEPDGRIQPLGATVA
jgi:LuxR family transcriptional regulator, maltose regulon positive regulatory protein